MFRIAFVSLLLCALGLGVTGSFLPTAGTAHVVDIGNQSGGAADLDAVKDGTLEDLKVTNPILSGDKGEIPLLGKDGTLEDIKSVTPILSGDKSEIPLLGVDAF